MATLEELTLQSERCQALQACRNLMAKYSYYHSAMRHKDYVELWAKRDDDIFEAPWGSYVGWDEIYQCYVVDHGDRSDPEIVKNKMPGFFVMHEMDTECLEVAADGQTARGAWITPGQETFVEDGNPSAEWCWGKYAVDFIKEDGVWKIWHMRLFPLFKCDYHKSWADTPQPDFMENTFAPGQSARPRAKGAWVWSPDVVYPANEPEPPLPYNTYDDVGYCL